MEEVKLNLENLDVSKSNGPDGISARMLKAVAASIAPSVTKPLISIRVFPCTLEIVKCSTHTKISPTQIMNALKCRTLGTRRWCACVKRLTYVSRMCVITSKRLCTHTHTHTHTHTYTHTLTHTHRFQHALPIH